MTLQNLIKPALEVRPGRKMIISKVSKVLNTQIIHKK
jgi:hypothetical protein